MRDGEHVQTRRYRCASGDFQSHPTSWVVTPTVSWEVFLSHDLPMHVATVGVDWEGLDILRDAVENLFPVFFIARFNQTDLNAVRPRSM